MVELALRDIDRFQRQKVKDLKDVFINYAILQTEKYKKVISHYLLKTHEICENSSAIKDSNVCIENIVNKPGLA